MYVPHPPSNLPQDEYGTRIRPFVSPPSKVSLMIIICMIQQNQPGIMYTTVLLNPGTVFLVGMLGFVLDGAANKLCSKAFLISAFGRNLDFLPRGYLSKIV